MSSEKKSSASDNHQASSDNHLAPPRSSLPPYIEDRGQDPEYIAALQAWAEQKKYVTPGEDGTYDISAGTLMKGFARPPDGIDEREAEERAREKAEKKRRKSEVKANEKDRGEGWGRRLSGLFHREKGKGGEGEEGKSGED